MKRTIYQIAEEINTSKQNVNQILKRALAKVYHKVKGILGEKSKPFDVVITMIKYFQLQSDVDIAHFFWELPEDIRKEVILDAKSRVSMVVDEDLDQLAKKNINHHLFTRKNDKTSDDPVIKYLHRINFDESYFDTAEA